MEIYISERKPGAYIVLHFNISSVDGFEQLRIKEESLSNKVSFTFRIWVLFFIFAPQQPWEKVRSPYFHCVSQCYVHNSPLECKLEWRVFSWKEERKRRRSKFSQHAVWCVSSRLLDVSECAAVLLKLFDQPQ